jgi:dTDP-glucose 4,6-dehydratase/UDP-glucose 4-epimerase
MKTVSLRIFSAYGTGLRKQLFWDLYQKMLKSKGTIELFGTGKETRDFIYVEDITQAIDCIINNAGFDGGVINVASGIEVKIEEVAHTFVRHMNKDLAIKFMGNGKKGDPLNWRADIGKLQTLGFNARVDMNEGIKKLAEWLKNLN